MEEWTKAMLKQAEDDLERKVAADLAKLREIINRKPVLPETMEITIVVLMNTPYGPRKLETGRLHLHYVTDTKTTVKPTTTVGRIKDYILEIMPILEYNRIEIEYWGVDLPDDFTVQQICNKWSFMKAKILHLHIFSRNPTFKKMYKYFIDKGISQQKAKNQTKTIMQFFKNKGVDIKMGISEAKAKILAKNIMDTFQNQNMCMSAENANEMTETIMNFFRNKNIVDTNVSTSKEKAKPSTNNIVDTFQKKHSITHVGTSKEKAKPSAHNNMNTFRNKHVATNVGKTKTSNNIYDTFLNKHIATNMGPNKIKAKELANNTVDTYQNKDVGTNKNKKKAKKFNAFQNKQAKDQMDYWKTFQENYVDASMAKKNTIKRDKDKMDTFLDNGVDASMGKEHTKKEKKEKYYTFQDNGVDTSMGKENTKKENKDTMDTFLDNGVDTIMGKENTKKESKEIMDTFQDNGVDTSKGKDKTKKQAKNMDEEKLQKQVAKLKDTLQKEVVDREKEIAEKFKICRAKLLELCKLFPLFFVLPPSPDQE